MSDQKLVSPLLDGFATGNPMGGHDGVRCCPAIKENSDEKYIVKIISIPASQVQLDALLLTGAYKDPAEAMDYFREVADGVVKEAQTLQKLSKLEGFLSYDSWQVEPMEEGKLGYEVYLLGPYKRTLGKHLRRHRMTHLEAVNLGLDLCQALTICRRAGVIYADLKPGNIFISKGREYRIGDLGFVELDALPYTSLPDKYHSPYAPPEVLDPLNTLNETVDTYALGMILYQIYNDGSLPTPPREPKDPFPSPANADYELAEIIMKAIAPDPKDRWQDPMAMGQALVGYMQRNAVNNTPIQGPPIILGNPERPVKAEAVKSPPVSPEESGTEPASPEADLPEPVPETPEETPSEPDPLAENLPESSEEPPEPTPAEPSASLSVFDDNVVEDEDEDDFDFDLDSLARELAEDLEEPEPAAEEPPSAPEKKPKKSMGKGWIAPVVTLLILALLGCGAFFYYQNFYLQTIDALTMEGSLNGLTVTVQTDVDSSLLTVSCTDPYGNTQRKALTNGQAVFTDLQPNSQYKIHLEISGFHKLVGQTTDVFNTEAQTNVVSFTAVTGAEDGSVMLTLTVDGPEPEEWTVTCSAEGEETITETFTGHNVTIKGLVVDKIYIFELSASSDVELLGQTSLEYNASQLVIAENLAVVSCIGGDMTVRWDAPAGVSVESWSVRCYAGGYDETKEVTETFAMFSGIDSSLAYTVEVTAAGMTSSARTSITANPINITALNVNADDAAQLTVTWEYTGAAPENGWLLMYSVDGSSPASVVRCDKPSAVISPRIPGANYDFEIQSADATSIFGNTNSYRCPAAETFSTQGLSADKITGYLVKTPEEENWTYESVGKDAFTDTFASGDLISFVLYADERYYIDEEELSALYVIRDSAGNAIPNLVKQETIDWKALWSAGDYHYGELDIPAVPTEAGDYTVSLYFNGAAVTTVRFSITQ